MRKILFVSLVLLVATSATALADRAADENAIRQTVLDYIEGWYSGDPERMEQALHPDLAKRIVVTDDDGARLEPLSALGLVQGTRSGWGTRTPADQQKKVIEIFDVDANMASVKLTARDWVDYMHLGKWNGRWVIINVLWIRTSATRQTAGD